MLKNIELQKEKDLKNAEIKKEKNKKTLAEIEVANRLALEAKAQKKQKEKDEELAIVRYNQEKDAKE